MHRVDTNGSVNGRFNDGNPAVGQQSTQLGADWCNDVQENLAHIIEEAGLVLGKGDATQLFAAVLALIAGVVGTGGGAVPTTRTVTGSGLVTGGGALAVDRVLDVAVASPAQAAALILNNVALTPLSISGLMGLTSLGGGHVIRVGPVILMIVGATANGNGTTIVTLPDTFPNQVFAGWCNAGRIDTGEDQSVYVSGVGLSSVSLFSAINSAVPADIFVIGR